MCAAHACVVCTQGYVSIHCRWISVWSHRTQKGDRKNGNRSLNRHGYILLGRDGNAQIIPWIKPQTGVGCFVPTGTGSGFDKPACKMSIFTSLEKASRVTASPSPAPIYYINFFQIHPYKYTHVNGQQNGTDQWWWPVREVISNAAR